MAISDLAKQAPLKVKKGPPCEVCLALDTIPAAEAAGLVAMLSDPQQRYTKISAQIRVDPDTPLNLTGGQLGRHARGDCDARTPLRGKRR